MTFKAKMVAFGVVAAAATAIVDVISGLGPLVLMCAYAGFVGAWAIHSDKESARPNVDLKKAA